MKGDRVSSSSSVSDRDDDMLPSLLPSPIDFQPSHPPSPLSSLEKSTSHYSSKAVRWTRHNLAAVRIPQRVGLSRRHKLLAVWASLLCAVLFLARNALPLPSYHSSNDIYHSGFAARGHHIPTKIWQIMFVEPHDGGSFDFDPILIPYSHSWLARNPDYQYTLVGTRGANRFVSRHFSHDKRVLNAHFGLRNHGPRSDFMRYLLMLIEGGVYSDNDVTCLKPIDEWIPLEWRKKVRAVVGIEGDSMGQGVIEGMLWDVQFGQWTVAAVPGHRLFRRMVENVVDRLEDLCALKNTTIEHLQMTQLEILNSTGTALWSETIFKELQAADRSLKQPLDLSGLKEPRLFGDILVLPIDGIAYGVPHSGASVDEIPDTAIVQHHFHGSWRDSVGIEPEVPEEDYSDYQYETQPEDQYEVENESPDQVQVEKWNDDAASVGTDEEHRRILEEGSQITIARARPEQNEIRIVGGF